MLPERYPRKPSVWFTSHSEMTSAMFTIQCACAIQTSCELVVKPVLHLQTAKLFPKKATFWNYNTCNIFHANS